MMKKHLLWVPLLAGVWACGGSLPADSDAAAKSTPCNADPGGGRVVVAVIDSAFNPYHEFFHANSRIYPGCAPSSVTPEVLAAFGIDASRTIDVTRTGNLARDIATDEAKWNPVRSNRFYWFKGTNVIGISFNTVPPLKPEPAKNPHGVGTVSRVLEANPDAIIVFIEGVASNDGETLAMTHPMVDVITTSYGLPGSLPLPGHIESSFTGTYLHGKLHFGASDNSPALSPPDGTSGPWWSVGIAGFQEGTSEGREAVSGNVVDFIADFTQGMPYCMDCERGERSVDGTSFATPTSAGVFSKILLEARRATGHSGGIVIADGQPPAMVAAGGKTITNWQFRRALEEAAWVPGVTDYSAGASYPIPPVAPWTVVGWGVISPDPERGVVQETLAHLGIGASPTRFKEPGFCEHQTATIDARKFYWDFVNVGSETFLDPPQPDPFIYCPALIP
jgi:hypothetical protein